MTIKMPRTTFIAFLIALFSSPAPSFAQPALPSALLEQAATRPVRVLIRVRADAPTPRVLGADGVERARQRVAAAQDRVRAWLDAPERGRRLGTLPWLGATVTRAELQRMAQHPDVVSIEPDVRMRPSLAQSTNLIHTRPLWQFGFTGVDWSIAILDTGVDREHSFLGGRVVQEGCFSSNDPAANATSLCAGGVEQVPAPGPPGTAAPCPSSVSACGHGTHVAGIAAGSGSGGSGVAPGARLIATQIYSRIDDVADCSPDPSPCVQSFVSDQVLALQNVLARAGTNNANRIAAVNLSLSIPGVFADACDGVAGLGAFKDAVDALRAIGIATIVSAGNEGQTGLSAPACLSNVISVGSTYDTFDVISGFSNRSPRLSLLAPGFNITSSVPGGGFATSSGTSMATPHVSGAWALMKQIAPGASVSMILSLLRGTGVTIPDAAGLYPRIDLVPAAIVLYGGVPPPPSAPLNASIAIAGNHVTLSWDSPSPGGGPVAEYVVAGGSQPQSSEFVFSVGPARAVSAIVAPGTYHVRVHARNPIGASPASNEVSFTVAPPTPPNPPTGFTANVQGSTVTLTWQAPASGDPPLSYIIEAGTAPALVNILVYDFGSPATQAVFTNVAAGAYHVRLRTRGAAGVSAPTADIAIVVP